VIGLGAADEDRARFADAPVVGDRDPGQVGQQPLEACVLATFDRRAIDHAGRCEGFVDGFSAAAGGDDDLFELGGSRIGRCPGCARRAEDWKE
jgi:hypothetical protein